MMKYTQTYVLNKSYRKFTKITDDKYIKYVGLLYTIKVFATHIVIKSKIN